MNCRTILPLLLAVVTAGCDAGLGLGIGTRCAAQMQEVRLRHGTPDRVDERARSQFWFYNEERLTYEFSWDQEGENCSVRQSSFIRLPAVP